MTITFERVNTKHMNRVTEEGNVTHGVEHCVAVICVAHLLYFCLYIYLKCPIKIIFESVGAERSSVTSIIAQFIPKFGSH